MTQKSIPRIFCETWISTLAMLPAMFWWSCRVAASKLNGWDWAARSWIRRKAGRGWAPISRLGDGWVYAATVLWEVHSGHIPEGEHIGACVGLAWSLSAALKYVFRRLRPDAQILGREITREWKPVRSYFSQMRRWRNLNLYGFPSQHVAVAVAFAIAVPSAWPLAAAMCVSRVADGAHFPGDVLAGILVGVAAGVWG